MRKYIATEAVIPLRSSPSESAEMVSQILFGEIVTGSKVEGNWCFVKNEEDGYEGWLTKYMITEIPEHFVHENYEKKFVGEHAVFLQEQEGGKCYLPMGARVPTGEPWMKNGQLTIGNRTWEMPTYGLIDADSQHDVLTIIRPFLNVPYLWGGRSSFGIDCSGLTQITYRMCGKFLPRDSSQQWKEGNHVSWKDSQEGDLAFFTKENETKISHVGMLMDENMIIHASGRVRIDELRQEGIMNKENKELTHHLLGIKRFL